MAEKLGNAFRCQMAEGANRIMAALKPTKPNKGFPQLFKVIFSPPNNLRTAVYRTKLYETSRSTHRKHTTASIWIDVGLAGLTM